MYDFVSLFSVHPPWCDVMAVIQFSFIWHIICTRLWQTSTSLLHTLFAITVKLGCNIKESLTWMTKTNRTTKTTAIAMCSFVYYMNDATDSRSYELITFSILFYFHHPNFIWFDIKYNSKHTNATVNIYAHLLCV